MYTYPSPVHLPVNYAWGTLGFSLPADAVAAIVNVRTGASSAPQQFHGRASSAEPNPYYSQSSTQPGCSFLCVIPLSSSQRFDYYTLSTWQTVYLIGYLTADEFEPLDPMVRLTLPAASVYTSYSFAPYCPDASAIVLNAAVYRPMDVRHPGDPTELYVTQPSGAIFTPCDKFQSLQYKQGYTTDVWIPGYFKNGKVGAIIPRQPISITNTSVGKIEDTPYRGLIGAVSGASITFELNDRTASGVPLYSIGGKTGIITGATGYYIGYAESPVTFYKQGSLVSADAAKTFDWRPSGKGYAKQQVIDFNLQETYSIDTLGTYNGIICSAVAAKIDSFQMSNECVMNLYGTDLTINAEREISVPLSSPGQAISFTGKLGGLVTVTLYTQQVDITYRG